MRTLGTSTNFPKRIQKFSLKFMLEQIAPVQATFSNDVNDIFHDRRLSDLLPADFIRQIGFDPDQYIFQTTPQSRMRRRRTEPTLTLFDPAPVPSRRRSEVTDIMYGQMNMAQGQSLIAQLPQMPPGTKFYCYEVRLSDFIIHAYSFQQLNWEKGSGVFIRDGRYIRYGQITKNLQIKDTDPNALQIVGQDIKGAVGDFIYGVNQIAQKIVPNLILQSGSKVKFISLEIVSYQARSLIRVKVTNADDPYLLYVMQKLIYIFGPPVEVYDDLSA